MKRLFFIIVICLFSTLLSNAQNEGFKSNYFVYTLQDANNVAIVWIDTALQPTNPSHFLIEVNGEIKDIVKSNKNVYYDTNLSIGVYAYRIIAVKDEIKNGID